MDYKRNKLFFAAKRVKVCTYVSLSSYVFFAVALYVFIVTTWLPPALPFVCIGTVILITCMSLMTSESQYKQQVAELREEMKKQADDFFDYAEEDPDHFFRFESYDLSDPSLPIRLGKNNRVYSSTFTVGYLRLTQDALSILNMSRSLTEEGELEKHSATIKYTDLSGARVVNDSTERVFYDGRTREVKRSFIEILDKNSQVVAKIESSSYDYNMDKFKELLDHDIERASVRGG